MFLSTVFVTSFSFCKDFCFSKVFFASTISENYSFKNLLPRKWTWRGKKKHLNIFEGVSPCIEDGTVIFQLAMLVYWRVIVFDFQEETQKHDTPRKLTYPLKSDHFKRKFHLPTNHFSRGYLSFQWGYPYFSWIFFLVDMPKFWNND